MSRLIKSSGAVAAATLISRILGFLRESAYAGFMGTGFVADCFLFALQVPNLFRRLLGEGALTAAFVPIFKAHEAEADEAAMWRGVNAVISGLLAVTGILVVVVLVGLTIAIHFVPMTAKHELIASLLRWMFPYVGLACLAAVFIGILNARGHFFLPALGTAILSLVMIASVYFLAPWFGPEKWDQVYGLAAGLVLAGFCQAAVQLPSLHREGFRYRWVHPWNDPTVRQVVRKMAPATIGVAAYQINVMLTAMIALQSGERIISSFNYAVRLMELPQGVVGVSLATYLLTELSHLAVARKFPEFRATLREGMQQLIFINGLATVLLLVLAEPMIRLLFQHGVFRDSDTRLTAVALRCLAPGLIAFSLNNIVARAFYALGDTRTPMVISVACLALNLILGFLLIPLLYQAGMGLANSISAIANTGFLFYALRRALPKFSLVELAGNATSVAGAAVCAAAVAWGINLQWENWVGHGHFLSRLGAVFVPIGLASLVYLALAHWMKLPQAHDLIRTMLGIFRRGSKPVS
jgi:putative peptidoglycan lipid II flippase